MPRLHTYVLSAILLAALSRSALARTEYFYTSGTCTNGNTWYCVTEVVDGHASSFRGVDCAGNEYLRSCSYLPSPVDPYGGRAPNLNGTCPAAGSIWAVLVTFDASGYPAQVCGQDCTSQYWTGVISPSKRDANSKPEPPAPTNAAPRTERRVDQ